MGSIHQRETRQSVRPILSLDSRPRGILVQLRLRLRIHRAAVRGRDQFQRASLHGGDGVMFVRIRDEQGKCR